MASQRNARNSNIHPTEPAGKVKWAAVPPGPKPGCRSTDKQREVFERFYEKVWVGADPIPEDGPKHFLEE
jgi:hypothetical protein